MCTKPVHVFSTFTVTLTHTHIRDVPHPSDAPIFPSSVFTDKPWTTDQQALKTGLMGVCVCVHALQSNSKLVWLTAPLRPLKMGELLIGVFPIQPYHCSWPPLPLFLFPAFPFPFLPHSCLHVSACCSIFPSLPFFTLCLCACFSPRV